MIARRSLLLSAISILGAAVAHRAAAAPGGDDPLAIINAIYARVTKGKGDEGGGFVVLTKAARQKYLSKSLAALWAKGDAATPKGDVGAIDADPITNSLDPLVKSFKAVSEKSDADTATIAVTLAGPGGSRRDNPVDDIIRYDFVREAGGWQIDDIRGAVDGQAWSVRAMLNDFLKLMQKGKK